MEQRVNPVQTWRCSLSLPYIINQLLPLHQKNILAAIGSNQIDISSFIRYRIFSHILLFPKLYIRPKCRRKKQKWYRNAGNRNQVGPFCTLSVYYKAAEFYDQRTCFMCATLYPHLRHGWPHAPYSSPRVVAVIWVVFDACKRTLFARKKST